MLGVRVFGLVLRLDGCAPLRGGRRRKGCATRGKLGWVGGCEAMRRRVKMVFRCARTHGMAERVGGMRGGRRPRESQCGAPPAAHHHHHAAHTASDVRFVLYGHAAAASVGDARPSLLPPPRPTPPLGREVEAAARAEAAGSASTSGGGSGARSKPSLHLVVLGHVDAGEARVQGLWLRAWGAANGLAFRSGGFRV